MLFGGAQPSHFALLFWGACNVSDSVCPVYGYLLGKTCTNAQLTGILTLRKVRRRSSWGERALSTPIIRCLIATKCEWRPIILWTWKMHIELFDIKAYYTQPDFTRPQMRCVFCINVVALSTYRSLNNSENLVFFLTIGWLEPTLVETMPHSWYTRNQ